MAAFSILAKDIPIKFQYKSRTYEGEFSSVNGGGANVWHLMINKRYYGVLQFTENNAWQFHGNAFEDMGDFFGDYVTAWVE